MIRILLGFSVAWWLAFYFWPLETIAAWLVVCAACVREAVADWPTARVRR